MLLPKKSYFLAGYKAFLALHSPNITREWIQGVVNDPSRKMKKVTSTRKTLPTTFPSVPVTISATGVEEAVSAAMFPDATLSATRKAKPTIPLNSTENHIAVGTT